MRTKLDGVQYLGVAEHFCHLGTEWQLFRAETRPLLQYGVAPLSALKTPTMSPPLDEEALNEWRKQMVLIIKNRGARRNPS